MKKFGSRLAKVMLFVTIPFLVLTLIELLTEITGGKIGDYIKTHYGINTRTLVFCLLGLLFLSVAYQIYEKWNEEKATPETINNDNIKPNFKLFFDSLKERYKKRYESKLDGRFEITLEVGEDWHSDKPKTYKFDADAKISSAVEAIRNSFDEKGRLLIIGSPGSGKTVLLLKLALELLGNECQVEQKLPVIFNLASWSEKYEMFEDWLIDVLNLANGLQKDFAKTLLREKRIIFLLDGLDELARNEDAKTANDKRAKCLDSINEYLREGRNVIICCRHEVFVEMQKTTNQDAPVSAKVEVLDLTKPDIFLALYYAQNHNESRASVEHLEKIVETNDVFLEILSTPFYFTTALEVFDKPLQKVNSFSTDAKEIKNQLLDKFIENKFYQTRNLTEFEKDTVKIKKWLEWLANLMENKQLVTFELADLQPSDITKKWMYKFIASIIISFWMSLLVSSIIGFGYSLYYGLISSVILFLFFVFYVNLAAYFNFSKMSEGIEKEYKTHDIVEMNLSRLFRREYWKIWAMTLFMGILVGVSYDFTSGLFVVLVYIQLFILNLMKEPKNFIYIEDPYQRFYGNINIDLKICLFSLIFSLIILYFSINGSVPKFIIGLIIGFGIIFPLMKLFMIPLGEHILVRLALYLEGVIPLKYATFLSYVADANVLEQDGGFWRFRHQILQEYFINLSKKNN